MVRIISTANLGCSVPLDSCADDIGVSLDSIPWDQSDREFREERQARNLERLLDQVVKPVKLGRKVS